MRDIQCVLYSISRSQVLRRLWLSPSSIRPPYLCDVLWWLFRGGGGSLGCVSAVIFFLLFFFFSFFFWFTTLFSKIAQLFPIRFDAFIFLFFGFPEGRGVVVYSSLFSYSFSLFFSVPSLILLLQTMECVCFFFLLFFPFFVFCFSGGLPPSLYGTFLSVVFGTPPASSHAWKHPIIIPMYYWKQRRRTKNGDRSKRKNNDTAKKKKSWTNLSARKKKRTGRADRKDVKYYLPDNFLLLFFLFWWNQKKVTISFKLHVVIYKTLVVQLSDSNTAEPVHRVSISSEPSKFIFCIPIETGRRKVLESVYNICVATSSIKHRRFLSYIFASVCCGSAAFDAITRNRRRQASSSLLVIIRGRELHNT